MFKRSMAAADLAFDKIRGDMKVDDNSRLKQYNQLKDKDFQYMTDRYGPDVTAEFIHQMEARRLHAASGGGDSGS